MSLPNIWRDYFCMNCTNMIGSLSISDDVSFYLPENPILSHNRIIIVTLLSHVLPLTSTSEIVVWFYGEGIRRPMCLTHEDHLGFISPRPLWQTEDHLGFISPRPLWQTLIHHHPERVYVVEKKDQRNFFYFSLRLAHSDSASRASSPKLDALMSYMLAQSTWSTRGAIPSAPRALRFCTGQQDQPLLLRLSMLFALALASRVTTPRSLHLGWHPLSALLFAFLHSASNAIREAFIRHIPASEPTSDYSAMVPST